MSRGINKVTLIGNVGNDPYLIPSKEGGFYTTIELATTEYWIDKKTGQKNEATEWHSVIISGTRIEKSIDYISKGSRLYIEGKLKTNRWIDKKTGGERSKHIIICYDFEVLESSKVSSGKKQTYSKTKVPLLQTKKTIDVFE